MIKYYYFHSYKHFNKNTFEEALRTSYSRYLEIEYFSDIEGVIISDEFFYSRLHSIYKILEHDLEMNLLIMESYSINELSEKCLQISTNLTTAGAISINNVIEENIKKDPILRSMFIKQFNAIDNELLEIGKYYLICGLNAINTSKELFLHRNTLNNKLDKFYNLSGIDIRDYRCSLFFDLYLKSI